MGEIGGGRGEETTAPHCSPLQVPAAPPAHSPIRPHGAAHCCPMDTVLVRGGAGEGFVWGGGEPITWICFTPLPPNPQQTSQRSWLRS